jgi:hypothetical protein
MPLSAVRRGGCWLMILTGFPSFQVFWCAEALLLQQMDAAVPASLLLRLVCPGQGAVHWLI